MYLGMDVGTSGVKAVLVNEAGAIVATASRGLDAVASRAAVVRAGSGCLGRCGDRALSTVSPQPIRAKRRQVRGIGLSGQMHGATLLGADGRPLRPAILWNDGRSYAECAELERRCPSLHAIAGNLAMPGFTAPKLLWVARHEPEVFAKVAKVLLPKAYVRYRLTGEMVEDMSDAAGTLWLDVGRRCWSETVLEATGLGLAPHAATGRGQRSERGSLAEFARRWGMAPGRGGRRRRRRLRSQRDRARRDCARRCVPVARDVGRAVPRHGPVCAGAGFGRPRLLPRASRSLAPDGRDVVGRGLAGLARAHPGDTGSRTARPARRGRRTAEPGAVSALSRRRAHAAQ